MIDYTGRSYRKIRVFVASPEDVSAERSALKTVIDEFNRLGSIADYFGLTLELLDWRTHVMPLMGRPEDVVLDQLPVHSWDIFVGILWLRFGTQTGALKPGTSEPFGSGTEEEFWLAYNAAKTCGRPKMLFYCCTRVPASLDEIDPDQFKSVKTFLADFQPCANHPGLPHKFQTTDDFERRVRTDLNALLIEYSREVLHQDKPPPPSVMEFAVPKIPNTLPRPQIFFGRKEEIARALGALDPRDRRFEIVIDGIGGIGKTALAVEIAYTCKAQGLFDAFIFVTAKTDRLKPTGIQKQTPEARSLEDFINESARALGQNSILRLTSLREKKRAFINALRDRRVLLIFDNLETLPPDEIDAVSEFVTQLPDDCKVIITSRWRVGDAAFPLRLDKLKWEEAQAIIENQVEKYEEELRELKHAGEAGWKQLYGHAGGSPLVILHAIGLIRMCRLSFEEALNVVRNGSNEADLNQFIYSETLDRLDEHEKKTLGALSLFGESASFLALVNTVNLGRHALEPILERLRGFSLVNWVGKAKTQEVMEDRYSLHPLTKRLARSTMMEDRATAEAIEARFIKFWTGYAINPIAVEDKGDQPFELLENEWANLEAAAQLLLNETGDKTAGEKDTGRRLIELTQALREFLQVSGRADERILLSVRAYEEACALREWNSAGWLAHDVAYDNYTLERLEEASAWIDKCRKVWAKVGGKKEQIALNRIRGLIAQERREYSQAEGFLKRALALERELGLEIAAASTLNELGNAAYERKKYKAARRYLLQAIEIAVKHDDKAGQAAYIANLGSLALDEKKLDEAVELFNRGLALSKECGLIELSAGSQYSLARVLEARGETDTALRLAKEVLPIYERLGHADLKDAREFVERLEMIDSTSADQ